MSPREEQTEPRRPHTFYLTNPVWEELERRYLEQRLAGGTLTKIAFVETVLRAGLDSSTSTGPPKATRPPARKTAAPRQPTSSASGTPTPQGPVVADEASTGAASRPLPAAQSRTDSSASQTPNRSTALTRLRQASDPGRPAPITSAAPIREPSDGSAESTGDTE